MKLHLPKLLLTAVLAVVATQTTVQASQWNSNTGKTIYYVTETEIDTFDATVKDDLTIYLNADTSRPSENEPYPPLETTISTARIKEGQLLYIDKHAWDDETGTRNFKLLTIENLQIDNGEEADAGSLRVGSKQTVSLGTVSGTLTSLAVDAGGSLTLNNKVKADAITVDAEGKLATKVAQDYSKISGAGSLIINYASADLSALTSSFTGNIVYGKGGVASMNGDAIRGAALYVDGGSVTLNKANSLTKSVYVTNKGTLTIGVTDLIATTNQTNQTISIDDSTLAIGTTRFALSLTHKLVLNNATVTGTGDGHGAIDLAKGGNNNVVGTHYITASGNSTIEGAIRVRDGNTASFDVAENGTLTVGTIVKGNNNNNSSIAKTGKGTLKITSMDSRTEAFIQGTTTITEGTLEYALAIKGEGESATSSFTYGGVVKGAGTLAKSGTAELVLSKVTDFSGKLDVKEGSLTINSLAATHTIDVGLANNASLSVSAVEINSDTHNLSLKEGSEDTRYFTLDGTTESDNGFEYREGTYVLFNGYKWEGSVAGFKSVTSDDKNTYVTGSVGSVFYVNKGTVTYDATTMGKATAYVVGAEGTYSRDMGNSNVNINDYLSKITAEAGSDIVVKTTGAVTQGGALTIAAGGTLTIDGAATYTNGGSVINNGGTLVLNDVASATFSGGQAIKSNLILKGTEGSTTMTFGGDEVFSYGTSGLTIEVGTNATLDAEDTRQTVGSNTTIKLSGGSITGSENHTYGHIDFHGTGSKIQVTENSSISAQLRLRDGISIDVAEGKVLTISNKIRNEEFNQTSDGNITKTGAGKLVLSGANTYGAGEYGTTISAGTIETQNASALGTGKVVMNGGTLQQNGAALTVSAMDYKSGTVDNGGQNLTVEGTLNVESKMEITGTGATSIGTLNLAAGATLTTSGALTLGNITLDLSGYTAGYSNTLVSATNGGISWNEDSLTYTGLGAGLVANVGMVDNALQLTVSEIVNPSADDPTKVLSYTRDGNALTLTVEDPISTNATVYVGLLESSMADEILTGLNGETMVTIALRGSNGTVINADTIDKVVFVNEKGQGYWGEMVGSDDGEKVLMYNVNRIPEPTTATLSLLALMGLAARRRRQK